MQTQTRDQKYAAEIFKQVNDEVGKKSKEYRDSYGSMAHKLPVLIRSAGLCQALAFVEARGKDPHKNLLDHLASAVLGEGNKGASLSKRSRETSKLSEYMHLTHEVMAALVWYKRFAQSVLDVDASTARGQDVMETA